MPRAGGLLAKTWGAALQDAMQKLPGLTIDAAEHLLGQLLEELIQDFPPRPPKETAKAQWPGFVTDRQRRWYFWALKSGELARQGKWRPKLNEGWGWDVKASSAGIIGSIHNDAPHMPWVVGPDYPGVVYPGLNGGRPMYQARIHQGRWWQLGRYMEEQAPEMWEELNKRLEYVLRDLWGSNLWE